MACLLLVGVQFTPISKIPSNPPVAFQMTLDADPAVPHAARQVVARACMNCHSNETKWPWYSRVAPASWVVAKDVEQARAIVNFSEWGSQDEAVRAGLLAAACEDVRSKRMPPPSYTFMHPEARLSAADQAAICSWAGDNLRRLAHAGKQQTAQGSNQ